MPPKKKEVVEEKPIIIGRLGTNLKCGIVGLPNVGKSTFFNVLTKTQMAAAENFPFCTIDPNENKYRVQDSPLDSGSTNGHMIKIIRRYRNGPARIIYEHLSFGHRFGIQFQKRIITNSFENSICGHH